MASAPAHSEGSVFVSYSRRDTEFVDELRISLETYHFDVFSDQQDIAHGEPWEPRLRNLITQADTTVCLVSEAWIASSECTKELDIALELGRRVIPVVIEPVDPARVPETLARLQFVFFHGENHTYASGVADLIGALSDDIGWTREQTRFLALANDWDNTSRSRALLLRGEALQSATKWVNRAPPKHVHVLPKVTEFINASEDAQVEDERKKLRNRVWQVASAGGAMVAVITSIFLVLQVRADARAAVAELAAQTEENRANQYAWAGECTLELYESSECRAALPSEETPAPEVDTDTPTDTQNGATANLSGGVEELNSPDRDTRLRAGQEVANLIRAGEDDVLLQLVGELREPRLNELSASGRFNVIYMLNIADGPRLTRVVGEDLALALRRIEERAEQGVAIGSQTRSCLQSLEDKLNGAPGAQACG